MIWHLSLGISKFPIRHPEEDPERDGKDDDSDKVVRRAPVTHRGDDEGEHAAERKSLRDHSVLDEDVPDEDRERSKDDQDDEDVPVISFLRCVEILPASELQIAVAALARDYWGYGWPFFPIIRILGPLPALRDASLLIVRNGHDLFHRAEVVELRLFVYERDDVIEE